MSHNYSIGRSGEELVKGIYLQHGYTLLVQNYQYFGLGKGRKGEIDLIFVKNNRLHFVEVKSRSNLKFGHPLGQINPRKINTLVKTIEQFIHSQQLYNYLPQIDFGLVINGKVEIIQNAVTL